MRKGAFVQKFNFFLVKSVVKKVITRATPLYRTWDVLTGSKKTKFLKEGFDAYYDIAIIGGGAIGSCIAYFLANRILNGHKIAVIERDPTYQHACTTLSVGGIRQQFSLPGFAANSLF